MNASAIIVSIPGLSLTKKDKVYLKKINPFGIILFDKNIENKQQLISLIRDIKILLKRDVSFLVDQEGGRVQRLKEPIWDQYISFQNIGYIFDNSQDIGKRVAFLTGSLIADELSEVGININCSPVLDLTFSETHAVIGNRSFGTNHEKVSLLGMEMSKGIINGGCVPLIKHIPGHGRANKDSHIDLPIVDTSLDILSKTDFRPFVYLNKLPLCMTAHVLYKDIDPYNPATFSSVIIKLIRESINFYGIIITDDITMGALEGTMEEKISKTFLAGCDILLDCSSNNEEICNNLELIPKLSNKKLYHYMNLCQAKNSNIDRIEYKKELNILTK
ncbi:MAG: beta-N-acetylhexosaminidase [Rhodobiaceae bacterium]|jgi:beta-N-acetylhexosaminidase|nr:beta-N-acetylhexosaminidase [Rhodobiaceae bacterium]MBT5641432.1 beta-N-acetylhexosaminidase [Rhodobiaceae bacterium]